jgi:hypothetical protein
MALRVRGGAPEIEHGPHDDRRTIIDIDAELKPRAILFDSHGEFMTGEAIRWCARYSITLALPGGPGRLITMVESALKTRANTMTRMRDIILRSFAPNARRTLRKLRARLSERKLARN